MLWGFLFFCLSARASQTGPVFPSHRYPTDESFHLSYELGILGHDANFVSPLETDFLSGNASIKRLEHRFGLEIQPNRQFSLGGIFSFDALTLSQNGQADLSKSG